jgi:hypothetical protein
MKAKEGRRKSGAFFSKTFNLLHIKKLREEGNKSIMGVMGKREVFKK